MFEARIKAGVEFLDHHYGRENWLPAIDVTDLDMGDYSRCIVGQLENAEIITEDTGYDSQLGFDCTVADMQHDSLCYHTLRDEWIAAISALRA